MPRSIVPSVLPPDHRKAMLASARQRAKAAGLACTITVDDIEVPDFCPLLGLYLERSTGSRGASDSSPSLDRIHPDLGYVPGNVWVISYRANRIKNDATLDEMRRIVDNWTHQRMVVVRRALAEGRDPIEPLMVVDPTIALRRPESLNLASMGHEEVHQGDHQDEEWSVARFVADLVAIATTWGSFDPSSVHQGPRDRESAWMHFPVIYREWRRWVQKDRSRSVPTKRSLLTALRETKWMLGHGTHVFGDGKTKSGIKIDVQLAPPSIRNVVQLAMATCV